MDGNSSVVDWEVRGRAPSRVEAGAPDAAGASDPRPVSRGSEHVKPLSRAGNADFIGREKTEHLPDEIGLDWVSITGYGAGWARSVAKRLDEWEGERGRPARGFQGYAAALSWPSGAMVLDGHLSGRPWLLMNGSACRNLGAMGVHAVCQVAMIGGECKRIDIRRDLHGRGIRLIHDMIGACEARQLCLVKSWKVFPERDAATGALLGLGVYLGSTASMRFVRVYDKGLETGEKPEGCWVRYEAQLRDDYANEAAVEIFSAEFDGWAVAAFKRAVGVVDFRVGRVPGRSLEEFERPRWWVEFLGGAEAVRARMEPMDVDVDRWVEAVRHQYGAVIVQAAREAGVDLAKAAELIIGGAVVTRGTLGNPIVPKLAAKLRRFAFVQ